MLSVTSCKWKAVCTCQIPLTVGAFPLQRNHNHFIHGTISSTQWQKTVILIRWYYLCNSMHARFRWPQIHSCYRLTVQGDQNTSHTVAHEKWSWQVYQRKLGSPPHSSGKHSFLLFAHVISTLLLAEVSSSGSQYTFAPAQYLPLWLLHIWHDFWRELKWVHVQFACRIQGDNFEGKPCVKVLLWFPLQSRSTVIGHARTDFHLQEVTQITLTDKHS